MSDGSDVQCGVCGSYISAGRWDLGYRVCLKCGDKEAERERMGWCVAPISNKAAYTRITDFDLLKQINPKRTT